MEKSDQYRGESRVQSSISTLEKKKKVIFYLLQKTKEQNSYKWSYPPGKGRQHAKEQVESHPHPALSYSAKTSSPIQPTWLCILLSSRRKPTVRQNGPLKARVIPLRGLFPCSFTCLHTQNPPSSQLVSRDGPLGAWRAYQRWDLTIETFSQGVAWSVVWASRLWNRVCKSEKSWLRTHPDMVRKCRFWRVDGLGGCVLAC